MNHDARFDSSDLETPVQAELVSSSVSSRTGRPDDSRRDTPRRRRLRLPLFLFVMTCLSTFWVGVADWLPLWPLEDALRMQSLLPIRRAIIANWEQGLTYTVCVLAILVTHEMGHFLTTLRYHIPASFPYFIPFPASPIGTMGAVIGMDGMRANRRELFDIGLAGPLAGLVVALPIMWVGLSHLDLSTEPAGPYALDMPLTMQVAIRYIQPPGYTPGSVVTINQFNPYFMAGWVGLLITGLNMLPVSQLDGGHLIYTLFGKRAHWIVRGFMGLAIAYTLISQQYTWVLMIALVFLIGTDHPPTRDDSVKLGRVRTVIGYLSLAMPLLCFAPKLIIFRM